MTKTKAPESANTLFPATEGEAVPTAPRASRKKAEPVPASVHSLPAVPPPPSMTEVLAKLASNPNVDTAKMRELYDLMLKTEAKQHFHDSMVAMNLPSINKDGKIPVQGGKALRFASFENVHKAVVPILREHGFRMSFQPMPGPENSNIIYVHCKLIRGVYEEECIMTGAIEQVSRAMNRNQAIGAAVTYASRNGMIRLLNLLTEAPEDRDTDAVVVADEKLVTAAQAKKLEAEIASVAKPDELRELIKQHYAIDAVAELPARRLKQLENSIATYKARQ